MPSLVRTVAPTIEPVTLQEQLAFQRILDHAEDAVVSGMITAARIHCENYAGEAFITQTWRLSLDQWPYVTRQNPYRAIFVDRPPLLAVSSITYTDTSGTNTTLGSSNYLVRTDSRPGKIAPAFSFPWPVVQFVPDAIVITYTAGYGATAASVPQTYREAIMAMAAHIFEVRDVQDAMTVSVPEWIKHMLDGEAHGSYLNTHSA